MINILPKKLTDLTPIRAQISSDVYRKGLRACHSAAPLPIPRTARLARVLAAQNLQSTEMRPITKQAAAMAARTIRSPFGTIISAARASRALASGRRKFAQPPLRGGELCHPRRFVLRRHPAVRRELIDEARQMLAQSGNQVAAIHPGLS